MICCERGLLHGGRSSGEKVWRPRGGGAAGARATGVAAAFGLLLEALIRFWRAGWLVVKEIACCYVAWWRPALMVFLPVGGSGGWPRCWLSGYKWEEMGEDRLWVLWEWNCGRSGSEGLSSGGLRGEWMGERSGCSSFGEWGWGWDGRGRRKSKTSRRGRLVLVSFAK